MKKLPINTVINKSTTKIKLLCACLWLLYASDIWANSVLVINSKTGKVFMLNSGKMQEISEGEEIPDFSDIITESEAQVTFSDFFDHQYHLASSGHIRVNNRNIDLKSGHLWIQSHQLEIPWTILTANAISQFQNGEAILSFDDSNGKTQLMVMNGEFKFQNILNKHFHVTLRSGEFSFISSDYEGGSPRSATLIGQNSYQNMVSLFQNVVPMSSNPLPLMQNTSTSQINPNLKRSIASIKGPRSGKIIFINARQRVKSIDLDLLNHTTQKELARLHKRKINKPVPPKKLNIPIYIYGHNHKSSIKTTSVSKRNEKKTKISHNIQKDEKSSLQQNNGEQKIIQKNKEFESSLIDNFNNQGRHDADVTKLIDDLESYQQDHNKDY